MSVAATSISVRLVSHDDAIPTSHLIVLSHGIDGRASDLHAIRDEIASADSPGVEVWETRSNEGGTHAGVFRCAERLALLHGASPVFENGHEAVKPIIF